MNLAGNKIGDLGMEIFLPFIENNHNLVYLDVSNNQIGDRGLLAIGGIILKNTSIQTLYAEGNFVQGRALPQLTLGLTDQNYSG